MKQTAADPDALFAIVNGLRYFKPGWQFSLEDLDRGQGCEGLTFVIHLTCDDAYHPDRSRSVVHYFIVPAAAYDYRSWMRWVFDQIGLVELHERCECFEVSGHRPYAPNHGPGRDPYVVHEYATEEEARTSFRGHVKPVHT